MSPGDQAYTTKSNELLEMMNRGSFEPNPFKPKNLGRANRNRKNNEDKEIVRAIIESSPNGSTPVELDLVEEEVPDSDSEGSELDSK